MKIRAFASVGFFVITALPAAAADLPVKARPVVPVMATAYNWSGCYIGGNVGGKWGSSTLDVNSGAVPGNAAAALSFGRDRAEGSIIGGGQVGCNWQAAGSNWVFGLEGDADAQRMRQSRIIGTLPPRPFLIGDSFALRSDWQASFRGRIGYAWDRWMLYGTGGLALTDLQLSDQFIPSTGVPTGSSGSGRRTLVGATVGGGLEYAITDSWSAAVEGRYSWYGSQSLDTGFNTIGPAPLTFAPITQAVRLDTFEVTGRLNWKFNWGGPVVARY